MVEPGVLCGLGVVEVGHAVEISGHNQGNLVGSGEIGLESFLIKEGG